MEARPKSPASSDGFVPSESDDSTDSDFEVKKGKKKSTPKKSTPKKSQGGVKKKVLTKRRVKAPEVNANRGR